MARRRRRLNRSSAPGNPRIIGTSIERRPGGMPQAGQAGIATRVSGSPGYTTRPFVTSGAGYYVGTPAEPPDWANAPTDNTPASPQAVQYRMPGPGTNPGIFNVGQTQVTQPAFVQPPPPPTLLPSQQVAIENPPQSGESLFSSFLNTLSGAADYVVPDDLGGIVANVAEKSGLDWAMDRVNMVGSKAFAQLPGGPDPLTWDQAYNTPIGQSAIASGVGFSPAFGVMSEVMGEMPGWLGERARKVTPWVDDRFDLADPEDRRVAFEENRYGSLVSGASGAMLTWFVDPLVIGGKGIKATKAIGLSNPIAGQTDFVRGSTELYEGQVHLMNGTMDRAAPVAQMIHWATAMDEAGNPLRTATEIRQRKELRNVANRDVIASILHDAARIGRDDVESYNLGSLVARAAWGDGEALDVLRTKKAATALALVDAQGQANVMRWALNPAKRQRKERKYRGEYEMLIRRRAQLHAEGADLTEIDTQIDTVVDNLYSVKQAELYDPTVDPRTPEEREAVYDVLRDLRSENDLLNRALSNENVGMLQARFRDDWFGRDNIVGRRIEKSRQRRARQGYEASARQGAGARAAFQWRDDYFQSTWFKRAVRVWRLAGEERPSGYVPTKGDPASSAGQEVLAALNQVKAYSGAAIPVTVKRARADGSEIEETVMVGGVARKDQLFQRFASDLTDLQDVATAVKNIEKAVFKDVSLIYGVDKQTARRVYDKAIQRRDSLVAEVRDRRGYWVDPEDMDPWGKPVLHKSPVLETQLVNGIPMLDFRVYERGARDYNRQYKILPKKAVEAHDQAADFAVNAMTIFNDVWRPAVLLRLGYTQRNVMEGALRSFMYTGALLPLLEDAGRGVVRSGANTRRRAHAGFTRREWRKIMKSEGARDGAVMLPDGRTVAVGHKFRKGRDLAEWRARQANAVMRERDATIRNIEENLAKDDPDEALIEALQHQVTQMDEQLAALANDTLARLEMMDQWKARTGIGQETTTIDGMTWYGAFADPAFAPIAAMNASADARVVANMSLRAHASEQVYSRYRRTENAIVNPEDANYFDEWSKALNQAVRNSEVGMMVLRETSPDRIADWLVTTKRGKEVARFLKIKNRDEAYDYATLTYGRLMSYMPNPEMRVALRDGYLTPEQVQTMSQGFDLPVVHGVKLEMDLGSAGMMATWRSLTAKAFKYLGTIPEDRMVRFPFYSRRYDEVLEQQRVNAYQRYEFADGIPPEVVEQVHRVAHRTALNDTKRWLYTLDRRTNIGGILGETLAPFISATQNTLVRWSQLAWRNPDQAARVMLLWQAPDRMGWVDDEGNIRIPLNDANLPPGVREALDGMGAVLIPKNSLNLVTQNSDDFFLPTAGPLVQVPVSVMMEKGILPDVFSTTPPSWFTSAVGEDVADTVWRFGMDRTFGAEGTYANPMAKVLPPWMQKVVQVVQGEQQNPQYAYWYGLEMRTQWAEYYAGNREQPPSPEEITNRTRGLFAIRTLANLTLPFAPNYESKVQPMVDEYRDYQRQYGLDAARLFLQNFGPEAEMIGAWSTSVNRGGADPTMGAVREAKRWQSLIAEIAPELNGDFAYLGMIVNTGPYDPDEFDNNSRVWQMLNRIPGVSDTWRDTQDPQEAWTRTRVNTGWTMYLNFKDQLDAQLQSRDLNSYYDADAADLLAMKEAFMEQMRTSREFGVWFEDYQQFGSARASKALYTIQTVLNNDEFMSSERGNSRTWQVAQLYMDYRDSFVKALANAESSTLTAQSNAQMAKDWETTKQRLAEMDPDWARIQNRFLEGDTLGMVATHG